MSLMQEKFKPNNYTPDHMLSSPIIPFRNFPQDIPREEPPEKSKSSGMDDYDYEQEDIKFDPRQIKRPKYSENNETSSSSIVDYSAYPLIQDDIKSELMNNTDICDPSSIDPNDSSSGKITLWQFLLELLFSNQYNNIIRWTDNEGEFILLQAEEVAKLWGMRKDKNHRMNYDKLSRALRYYYQQNIIRKVQGHKFVYKFSGVQKVYFKNNLHKSLDENEKKKIINEISTNILAQKKTFGSISMNEQLKVDNNKIGEDVNSDTENDSKFIIDEGEVSPNTSQFGNINEGESPNSPQNNGQMATNIPSESSNSNTDVDESQQRFEEEQRPSYFEKDAKMIASLMFLEQQLMDASRQQMLAKQMNDALLNLGPSRDVQSDDIVSQLKQTVPEIPSLNTVKVAERVRSPNCSCTCHDSGANSSMKPPQIAFVPKINGIVSEPPFSKRSHPDQDKPMYEQAQQLVGNSSNAETDNALLHHQRHFLNMQRLSEQIMLHNKGFAKQFNFLSKTPSLSNEVGSVNCVESEEPSRIFQDVKPFTNIMGERATKPLEVGSPPTVSTPSDCIWMPIPVAMFDQWMQMLKQEIATANQTKH